MICGSRLKYAAKYSALWGSVPLKLPLEDRSLALYPKEYRWLGGDQSGQIQSSQEGLKGPLLLVTRRFYIPIITNFV